MLYNRQEHRLLSIHTSYFPAFRIYSTFSRKKSQFIILDFPPVPEVNPPSSQAVHLLTPLFSVVINLNGEQREPKGHIVLGQTEHFRWAVPPFHAKVVTKSFTDRECCLESLPVLPNSRLMRYINTWVKCPFTVLYHSVSSSLYSLLGI